MVKGVRRPSRELIVGLFDLVKGRYGVVDRPGFEPGTSRMPTAIEIGQDLTENWTKELDRSNTSQIPTPSTPPQSNVVTSREEIIEWVKRIVNDPEWLRWMKMRYNSKSHASFCFKSAKMYLVDVLRNPVVLRSLNYRRARGIIESIAPLREYARLKYGVELKIETKSLWRYMPPKPVAEITQAITEYEITEEESSDIVTKALEAIKRILNRNTKFKIPIITAFFTGLRATEIKYMFDNWSRLRKIELNNVVLVELNYDRNKKKAYITLMPKELAELISKCKIKLTHEWRNHVLHKFGIALGLLRKAWIAVTARFLDPAERDLLQGRLRSVQVRHYIKHVRDIARRYEEAFKPYLYLIYQPNSSLNNLST